ncbi:MAG: hypothetical protein FD180_661 [Planctomycetota bacterium]|nr:MAG: hypothetical protein FD180_661 [Planctomycetota bacterium]
MRAGDNPEVTKLVERESAAIARGVAALPPAFAASREAIGALLASLSQRQRYFALIGEHFSVFGFDGIVAMDRLDEVLLRAVQEVLKRRPAAEANERAESGLAEEFGKLPALEKHPVGYMVLFAARKMFEGFDNVLTQLGLDEDDARQPYENELLKRVAFLVDAYVTSRSTPVARHFGDLRREYWVVARMHCRCGQPKYEVKMQSLVTAPDGAHMDRLDVKCGACGDVQALEFPLPHFGDLSIA